MMEDSETKFLLSQSEDLCMQVPDLNAFSMGNARNAIFFASVFLNTIFKTPFVIMETSAHSSSYQHRGFHAAQ